MNANLTRLHDISKRNKNIIAYMAVNGIMVEYKKNVTKLQNGERTTIEPYVDIYSKIKVRYPLRIKDVPNLIDTDLYAMIMDTVEPYMTKESMTNEFIDSKLQYSYMMKYLSHHCYAQYMETIQPLLPVGNKDKQIQETLLHEITKYNEYHMLNTSTNDILQLVNYSNDKYMFEHINNERKEYKRYVHFCRRVYTLLNAMGEIIKKRS